MHNNSGITRRGIMSGGAVFAGATLAARQARAQNPAYGTTPPQAVGYRDQPNAGHACNGCRFFIQATGTTQPGHCHIVAGAVSPQGWCSVWTPKA